MNNIQRKAGKWAYVIEAIMQNTYSVIGKNITKVLYKHRNLTDVFEFIFTLSGII